MRFAGAFLVLGVARMAAGAEPALPMELTTQLQDMLAAPAVATAKLGVHVRRLDDGKDLFGHQPDASLIPASNMKIVSSAAALATLGPDYRFRTVVYASPDYAGTVNGDLVVYGDGDPSIVPERLWYLANRIYYAGLRDVRGNIVIDDSYFTGPRLANGWEQDRSSAAYMAPMGAVSLGFNAMLVHILPAASSSTPARVLLDPPSSYATVEGSIETVSRGRSYVNVDIVPSGDRSAVRVSGRVNLRDGGRAFFRRIDNPPLFFGDTLKAALEQLGVKVRGKVKLGLVPEGAEKLVTLTSPRLSEIVNTVNKNSNNFMAEQVALATGGAVLGAPASWDKAQAAIERFLEQDVGLQPGTYQVRNGSGLHDVNRMSPRQMVQILEHMYRLPRVFPEFQTSLAVAGGSGTLSERMSKTDAAHLLRAKTGTLSISSALSGYVTARSGETVAFSVLVNDYTSPISEIWHVQDSLGAFLAGLDFRRLSGDSVAQHTDVVP